MAVDDHARVGFTAMHPDERTPSAVRFLPEAVAYYERLGVKVQRLLTDNGSAFRSKEFRRACVEIGLCHRFIRPYRPQTNGKAERFIQSALREWAYGFTYQHSAQRTAALEQWIHHYNWHRPHQGIGRVAPISRLSASGSNLLALHSSGADARGAPRAHPAAAPAVAGRAAAASQRQRRRRPPGPAARAGHPA